MWVGIDDTDSLSGGCTTYVAALLAERIEIVGLPRLIRLNPSIPYKTRGNAAVALEVEGDYEAVRQAVIGVVRREAYLDDERTNPGVVFLEDGVGSGLEPFYEKAVSSLVDVGQAHRLIDRYGVDAFTLGNGRGLIGALAAVGAPLHRKTYELISYRVAEKRGTPRNVDHGGVVGMHEETYPQTFDNVDEETGQSLVYPRGKDPIYAGIRGVSEQAVREAWAFLHPGEPIERVAVFVTNQATDDHVRDKKIAFLRPFDCANVAGTVAGNPKVIEGGHVIVPIEDETGTIDCAAFAPTGSLRAVVKRLRAGDRVAVMGCIGKHPGTLNLEKIEIRALAPQKIIDAPYCCGGKKMTSAGAGKGFKCRSCSNTVSEERAPTKFIERGIEEGWYEAPPRARRHLSRPLVLDQAKRR